MVRGISGQSGTADGVAALARGDYQRAVEILRPIAEDWRSHDTAAQFFLAGLYDAGHGVPADPLRACALYLRAASNHDNPFGRQAVTVFLARNREVDIECDRLANIGFDHGFEPATFDLGPGHSVEWTLTAVTVTFEGHSRREPVELAQSTARFFPLQHTELATGPTGGVTRHFIEAFLWRPSGRTGGWNLQWHLFEVVRDQIVRIDTPVSVLTVDGDQPPTIQTFDVRDYAVMRVDDEGNAEWAVLKGPRTRTARIESEAERREVREANGARDAAMVRVDWSRRYDVRRTAGDELRGCRRMRPRPRVRMDGRPRRSDSRRCRGSELRALDAGSDVRSRPRFGEHLCRSARLRCASARVLFLFRHRDATGAGRDRTGGLARHRRDGLNRAVASGRPGEQSRRRAARL